MYQNYFGLKEQAFSIAVNPRYLYMSAQHREALAHLIYGVNEGGFVLLSGEVGTGKTTIIRSLLEQLPENTDIAIVLNPMANVMEILSTICDELGIGYINDEPSVKSLTDSLHTYLLDNHTRGHNTVLLIDEAQLLSAEALEQIRLLTNLETTSQKLLQIVLVGQPELNELLAQPRLRQLSQRITARFHLNPLNLEETKAYIAHRLSVAGMPEARNPFTAKIIKRIHSFTGGVPRVINILCERILIGAYGHNKQRIDDTIFQLARSEVVGKEHSQPPVSGYRKFWMGTTALLITAVCGAIYYIFVYQQSPTHPLKAQTAIKTESNHQSKALATAQTKTVPPTDNYTISNYNKAQEILFDFLSVDISSETHPCWQANSLNLQCKKTNLKTWQQVRELNRPLVLTLTTPEKFTQYAVLIGLNKTQALLYTTEKSASVTTLKTLGPLWKGEVFYTWQPPAGYTQPLTLGKRSKVISWVAEQFSLLDSQTTPLAKSIFNPALKKRIKIFQRANQLDADGVIGEQTLMKLNEVLGIDKVLQTDFAISPLTTRSAGGV